VVPAEEATKEYIGLLMAGIPPEEARQKQGRAPDDYEPTGKEAAGPLPGGGM
jgi:hypothetical protein